jgi:ATP-dependent helicase/nuclease subunit B
MVLDLRPLDPLGRQADALARGTAVHAAMDRFLAVTADGLPPDAADLFARTVEAALLAEAPWPAVRAIWVARLARIADWFLAGEAERRTRGVPLAREVRGRRLLHGLPHPFEITAKADRIDRMDPGFAIYDYKSGGVPSAKEAEAFHLQLPLEAAILEAGGFDGLPAGATHRMELIGLNTRKTLVLDPGRVPEVLARLCDLVSVYQSTATGYTARLRPQKLTYESDYDHLSRRGEWGDGDPPAGRP